MIVCGVPVGSAVSFSTPAIALREEDDPLEAIAGPEGGMGRDGGRGGEGRKRGREVEGREITGEGGREKE